MESIEVELMVSGKTQAIYGGKKNDETQHDNEIAAIALGHAASLIKSRMDSPYVKTVTINLHFS